MNMNQNADFMEDLGYLYQDLAATFLALATALDKAKALPTALLQEAAQERLLTLTVGRSETPPPFQLLRLLARGIPRDADG